MKLNRILPLFPVLLRGCASFPVDTPMEVAAISSQGENIFGKGPIDEKIWDEMIRWQSVWFASDDFKSLGMDKRLFTQVNGFLEFSENFLKKAHKEDQKNVIEPLKSIHHLQEQKKKKAAAGSKFKDKLKYGMNKWKGKLSELVEVKRNIRNKNFEDPGLDNLSAAHYLIDELDKLKKIVASYIEDSNDVPVVTLLRIITANIDNQLNELNDKIEYFEWNQDGSIEVNQLLSQSEYILRIAELLIETIDDIKEKGVDGFLDSEIGSIDDYLGALNTVEFKESVEIVLKLQALNEQETLAAPSAENNVKEGESFDVASAKTASFVPSKLRQVFAWFNATSAVPPDFHLKNNDRQLSSLGLKLFSYIAYQTIGGTLYCMLELAVPRSVAAWDNCGNFHSAQLRKEWILLSLILTKLTAPLSAHANNPAPLAAGMSPSAGR